MALDSFLAVTASLMLLVMKTKEYNQSNEVVSTDFSVMGGRTNFLAIHLPHVFRTVVGVMEEQTSEVAGLQLAKLWFCPCLPFLARVLVHSKAGALAGSGEGASWLHTPHVPLCTRASKHACAARTNFASDPTQGL